VNESRAVPLAGPTIPDEKGGALRAGLLSIVIPVFNEERGLPRLVDRLTAALGGLGRPWEVIFVDDGSGDGTAPMLMALNLRDPRYKAIVLSRNFGKEIAVAAGLRYATGAAAVVMDGDLQHPPEAVAMFVKLWEQGYDVVYGQRSSRATDSPLHRLSSQVFYWVFSWMSHTTLPRDAGDFRLIDRKVMDVLNRMDERARFNKGLFAWVGFRSIGVPYEVEARGSGKSRWRPRALLRFALDGVVSFSTVPLRVWSYLGLLVSAFAFIFAIYFFLEAILYGSSAPGFPTLIISLMFFAGVQLISLGVIGEYLGRIYDEVKGRPLFVVSREIGVGEKGTPAGGAVERSGGAPHP
jgi:glycosyltransferase involved in cell wall biosynthesis